MSAKLSDTEAMNQIQRVLSGSEWEADTADEIAEVVRSTGREIKDLNKAV